MIVFVGGYTASDEEGLPQILTLLLRMREIVAIGLGLGPLPVSFFSNDKDHHNEWRSKSSPHKGLGNDTISRALN